KRRHHRAAADVRDLAGRLNGTPARAARAATPATSARPATSATPARAAISLAGQPQQADEPEVVHVVPWGVSLRPVLAIAADRAVDDPRVLLPHPLVADAKAVEHPWPEGLEHDVEVAHEREQQL